MPPSDDSRVYVTNSEISTFKSCRRSWYLGTYLRYGQKTERVEGPLAFGSRIHRALELMYTDGVDPVSTWGHLVDEDRIKLLMTELDTEKFDKEAEMGRLMLEGYLEWIEETGADSDFEVIGAERAVSVPLTDEISLLGKMDLRVRRKSDGVHLWLDHKTTASFDTITKTAQINEQVYTYMLLELLESQTLPEDQRPHIMSYTAGAVFNMLRKTKRTGTARPPFYMRVEVRHSPNELRTFWARTWGVAHDILNARRALDGGADHNVVAYPTPTRDCTWKCDFFTVCSLIDDDRTQLPHLMDSLYQQGDPLARYSSMATEDSAGIS